MRDNKIYASLLALTMLVLLITSCKESEVANQSSSLPESGLPGQPNGTAPGVPATVPPNSVVNSSPSCGPQDLSGFGFDCNGRSLAYPAQFFDISDINPPHANLSESQLDDANEVLVCRKQGARFCQSLCVNQVFNFRHRYAVLYTGFIWPNSKCAYYIMSHNHESGLPKYEYFLGDYVNSASRVVGNCRNTDLNNPTQIGYYDFTENRVPQGQISPAPDRSRLYYALEFLDLNGQPFNRLILQNYQPMPDSNVVWSFSAPYGSIYAHFQQLPGFSCVKRDEITQSAIDLIR